MRTGDLTDPRAQRTRAALLAEFERQITEGAKVPTVASVIRGAGVSRGAFYCHFRSIEELGLAAVRTALEGLGERDVEIRHDADQTAKQAAEITFGGFVEHIASHRSLYRTLVAAPQDGSARAELREALILQMERSIDTVPTRPPSVRSRVAAAYIVDGVLGVLSEWLHESMPCEPHTLAESIAELMPSWFVNYSTSLPSIEVTVAAARDGDFV